MVKLESYMLVHHIIFQNIGKIKKQRKLFFNNYVTVGDLAYREKEGYIKLVDRKNMIISGGENIYPAEVENVLGEHKKIKDIAVVGQDNKKWGEIVCAFVVLEDGFKAF